jgi:bla regulator protein BlaR1
MLESLFKGILNISLYATVVAVAVMFIKLICGKRLSPNFHYGIWVLFLFKLVFPFEIKSMLSIFSLFNHVAPEPITEQINTVLPPITRGVFIQSANLQASNFTAEMPVAAKGLDLWNVAAVLWITGIIIMLAALVFSYTKTSKILKTTSEKPDSRLLDILSICKTELNIRYNIPVYTTGSFGIPFIFGFFKPRVSI